MSKIWICCSHCGSRDVTRDATTRWDDDAQEWQLSGIFDDGACDTCGEASLEEVDIVDDDAIPKLINDEFNWIVQRAGDGVLFELMDPDTKHVRKRKFETLADAYCYALKHDNT